MTLQAGRAGFTGSALTDWCVPCADHVVRLNNGHCPWCDDRASAPRPVDPDWRKKSRRDTATDARIAGLRRKGMSVRATARMVNMSYSGVRRRLERMAMEAADPSLRR